MKITDLQLSEYGIYRGASWQPSTSSLNVVMGENESGKTTMLGVAIEVAARHGRASRVVAPTLRAAQVAHDELGVPATRASMAQRVLAGMCAAVGQITWIGIFAPA
mgnify:CR=1 FL=1